MARVEPNSAHVAPLRTCRRPRRVTLRAPPDVVADALAERPSALAPMTDRICANSSKASLLLFAALLPIVNPFGGAPVFLAMTSDCTPELRATIAKRDRRQRVSSCCSRPYRSAPTCSIFSDLSVPVVQVAGGIVVCAAGWELLRSEGVTRRSADLATRRRGNREPRVLSADAADHRRARARYRLRSRSAPTIRATCTRCS